jgi:hypothetical protein
MNSPYLLVTSFHNPETRASTFVNHLGVSTHTIRNVGTTADTDAETALLTAVTEGLKFTTTRWSNRDTRNPSIPVIVQDAALVAKLNNISATKTKLGANSNLWQAIAEAKKDFGVAFYSNIGDAPADSILSAVMRGWEVGY